MPRERIVSDEALLQLITRKNRATLAKYIGKEPLAPFLRGTKCMLMVLLFPDDTPVINRVVELLRITREQFMNLAEWPPFMMNQYENTSLGEVLDNPKLHAAIVRVVRLMDR